MLDLNLISTAVDSPRPSRVSSTIIGIRIMCARKGCIVSRPGRGALTLEYEREAAYPISGTAQPKHRSSVMLTLDTEEVGSSLA